MNRSRLLPALALLVTAVGAAAGAGLGVSRASSALSVVPTERHWASHSFQLPSNLERATVTAAAALGAHGHPVNRPPDLIELRSYVDQSAPTAVNRLSWLFVWRHTTAYLPNGGAAHNCEEVLGIDARTNYEFLYLGTCGSANEQDS